MLSANINDIVVNMDLTGTTPGEFRKGDKI